MNNKVPYIIKPTIRKSQQYCNVQNQIVFKNICIYLINY